MTRAPLVLSDIRIFTVRKRKLSKVIFLHASVILFTGGGGLQAHTQGGRLRGLAEGLQAHTQGGGLGVCRVPTRTGKPGKMGRHFPVREKSGNFEQTGKVRENHTKYWKILKFEINII